MVTRVPSPSPACALTGAALAAAILTFGCTCQPQHTAPDFPDSTESTERDANAADRAQADQLLALAQPQLAFWLARWAQVDPTLGDADSLQLAVIEDFPQGSAIAFHPNDNHERRSLELFGVRSPDGHYAAIADFYRDARRNGGTLEVGFGDAPDSWAVLVDLKRDSVYTLGRVGTLGQFEEARWIDDQHLLVTYSGEDPDDASAYAGRVGVFDLHDHIAAWFTLPNVEPDALDDYRQRLETSERHRLASLVP